MLTTASPRRGLARSVALAGVAAVLSTAMATPAAAQETDDEGGTKTLREELDEAATAYHDAKAVLDESRERELTLTVRLEKLKEELAAITEEVQVIAATAYRTGRLGPFAALINSSSPTSFLERAATVDMLAKREQEMLADRKQLREDVEHQQELIAAEIELQKEEVAKLEAAKQQADDALYAVGGGDTGEFVAYEQPLAEPAPRNEDGSWPGESCSENDPTTGACLTPRTLHAYNEARIFGFTRYTSCYRETDFGEHGLGRACDFSVSANGFGAAATGTDKTYGDKLASFFVTNWDRLAVQYVIWYRQIWFPGSGWSSYGGAGSDPASAHTNHVHVSIR